MTVLHTTLGPYKAGQLGMILAHEHIFTDLRPIANQDHSHVTEAGVVALMAPELIAVRDLGVTALVECTPEGVGRRVDLVLAASRAVNFPVVVPTGIYREPWVPQWAAEAPVYVLQGWMEGELTCGVGQTGVIPAWIKLSAGDDGLTAIEEKILRAAARAAKAVGGATIGSHTIRARVVHHQLDVLESEGFDPRRFISIHAQSPEDFHDNLTVAKRGAWISYDGIGWKEEDDAHYIRRIQDMIAAGYGRQIILSHDKGFYNPGEPNGGKPNSFDYISKVFLPKLRLAGLDEAAIRMLTAENPFNCLAR